MSRNAAAQNEKPTKVKHTSPRITIPEFYRKYPGILEIYQDASKGAEYSQLPSITIFASAQGLRVCLCDRKRNRSIFRTGTTPADALESISTAIIEGRADWRPKRSERR